MYDGLPFINTAFCIALLLHVIYDRSLTWGVWGLASEYDSWDLLGTMPKHKAIGLCTCHSG